MPESHDFHAILLAADAVNDAIRAENYFAQLRAPKFWHDAATLRKCR
jgi:hypothetical protein